MLGSSDTIIWDIKTLGSKDIGILELWDFRALGSWDCDHGMIMVWLWDLRILRYWYFMTLDIEILVFWNIGFIWLMRYFCNCEIFLKIMRYVGFISTNGWSYKKLTGQPFD